MPVSLLEVGILVLVAAAVLRLARPALARLSSQSLDSAVRSWVERSEGAAGPYVHLPRGLARPAGAALRTPDARLAIETPRAQRKVA